MIHHTPDTPGTVETAGNLDEIPGPGKVGMVETGMVGMVETGMVGMVEIGKVEVEIGKIEILQHDVYHDM
jgi:hypothetical protein